MRWWAQLLYTADWGIDWLVSTRVYFFNKVELLLVQDYLILARGLRLSRLWVLQLGLGKASCGCWTRIRVLFVYFWWFWLLVFWLFRLSVQGENFSLQLDRVIVHHSLYQELKILLILLLWTIYRLWENTFMNVRWLIETSLIRRFIGCTHAWIRVFVSPCADLHILKLVLHLLLDALVHVTWGRVRWFGLSMLTRLKSRSVIWWCYHLVTLNCSSIHIIVFA